MPDWSKSGLWGAAAGGFPRTTKAVVHGSSLGFSPPLNALPPSSIVRTINAGVLTNAGQLYTVLRVTGAGEFTNLGLSGADANNRQPRLRVTCDGAVTFDVTGQASVWNGQVLPATIQHVVSGSGFFLPPISFTLSCLVEISSNLAADNGINLWYSLRSF